MADIWNARVWEPHESRELCMCSALAHVDCCTRRSHWRLLSTQPWWYRYAYCIPGYSDSLYKGREEYTLQTVLGVCTAVSGFLAPRCIRQSHMWLQDGTAELHVNSTGIWHVRLHCSNYSVQCVKGLEIFTSHMSSALEVNVQVWSVSYTSPP